MNKFKLLVWVIIIILGVGSYFYFSGEYNNAPDDSPKGDYSFTIKTGDNSDSLAEKLESENVISDKDLFLLKTKLEGLSPLQKGSYSLKLPSNSSDLINQINSISKEIKDANSKYNKPSIDGVLIREGLTVEDISVILDNSGVIDKSDFLKYVQNPQNFSNSEYKFLQEPLNCTYGTKNCVKYYLEGYMYPDTYSFFLNSSPKDVADKFLSNFNKKVWNNLDAGDKSEFSKTIIMASVLEKETGRTRGITKISQTEVAKERSTVAGAFFNRISQGVKWSSNPTVTYSTNHKLCEITIKIPNCKYLNNSAFSHGYNTYNNKGYPIGAISNPSFENIQAVLNPISSNYLFFIADDTGKTYFASTYAGHLKNISKVKIINKNLS